MRNFEVIGVLSLPDVLGEKRRAVYVEAALQDLRNLQDGGIDTILVENSGESATGRVVNGRTLRLMEEAMERLSKEISVPFLVGALPADYAAAFRLAGKYGAKGIWMDTLVDPVSPRYAYARRYGKKERIEIRPGAQSLRRIRELKRGRLVYAEVQPVNFYDLLEQRELAESVRLAKKHADAVCIVGDGGPPSTARIGIAREIVGPAYPIGVSGGLDAKNIGQYVGIADFGVIFSSIRYDRDCEKPVDPGRVRALMERVRKAR